MNFDVERFVPTLRLLLFDWLPRQRWFDATDDEVEEITVIRTEVIRREWPLVMWVPVEVQIAGAPVICQTVLALGESVPEAVPDRGVLGEVGFGSSSLMVFDALGDLSTAATFAAHVGGELDAGPVRSVVERPWLTTMELGTLWELCLYHRVEPGPHPDVELPTALGARECAMVRAPVAVWRKNRYDLAAIGRRSRRGTRASEAARSSIDALLRRRVQPRDNPLDIAGECFELGETAAALHVASAAEFGVTISDADELVGLLAGRLPRQLDPGSAERITSSYRRLSDADDLGVFIRVHGNLDLDSLTRERQTWILSRFGCDPDSSVMFDREAVSPLCDIASLIHDIEVTADEALARANSALDPGRGPEWENERSGQRELAVLAEAWVLRCVDAVIGGYTSNDAVHRLLPVERVSRDALLTLFELELSVRDSVRRTSIPPDLVRLPTESIDALSRRTIRRRW